MLMQKVHDIFFVRISSRAVIMEKTPMAHEVYSLFLARFYFLGHLKVIVSHIS